MRYHITTEIWLGLEEYYNEGLTPEKAKEIIEGITCPIYHNRNLRTETTHINGNLKIKSMATNPNNIEYIVLVVEEAIKDHIANNI